MAEYSSNEKNKVAQKLKNINIVSEKDILNLKVSELKKINENKKTAEVTLKDIKIIWQMQEAIENKKLFNFFTNID